MKHNLKFIYWHLNYFISVNKEANLILVSSATFQEWSIVPKMLECYLITGTLLPIKAVPRAIPYGVSELINIKKIKYLGTGTYLYSDIHQGILHAICKEMTRQNT